MNQAYPLAFVIGLLSALHCIGMCGGIAGALSLSLPVTRRSQTRVLMSYLVAFNLGRVLSYALAGALFGSLGGFLLVSGHLWLHDALRWLAALVMVGAGLAIAGWLPRLEGLEKIGAPVWRLLEPWGRRLLPVDTLLKAGLYGAVWGWLPCGLVYSVLIWSLASGSMSAGAQLMLAFGLGTLPNLLLMGALAARLGSFVRQPWPRRVAGGLVLVWSVVMLARAFSA
ncbi:MAG: sulfite exporter TauE/SafE family protein [Gammaproteobacteria bacterium]|nr:MAG: sulfite exporter TauE/SafE family protein [Gammaproteobacteria bacterium]